MWIVYWVNNVVSGVQGIGWWLEEANIAQISLNLTDMDLTPMHIAYEEASPVFLLIASFNLDNRVQRIFGRGFFGHLLKMPPAGLGDEQKQS